MIFNLTSLGVPLVPQSEIMASEVSKSKPGGYHDPSMFGILMGD